MENKKENSEDSKVYTYYYKNKSGNLVKHTKIYYPKKKSFKKQKVELKKLIDALPDDKLGEINEYLSKL